MNAPPPGTTNEPGATSADPVHIALWVAFAACAFLIILMSGVAAVSLAILVQREQPGVVPVEAPAETAEMRRQRALQAIRDGDYDRAVALTTEAVAAAPGEGDLEELRTISMELRDSKAGAIVTPAKPPADDGVARVDPENPRETPATAAKITPPPDSPPTPTPPSSALSVSAPSSVPARAVGMAVVTSSPKGLAFEIPGVVRGQTPFRATGVPEGTHDVIFYLDGKAVHTARVKVPKGGVELVDVNLERFTPPVPAPAPVAPEGTPDEVAPPLVGPTAVYVFVPGSVKSRVIQDALQAQLGGATVTAFSSFRDFKEAMATTPADAVIAPRAVLDALSLPTHLQGRDASGSSDQRYLLIGTRSLTTAEIESATIGTVDVAGRESSAEFVAKVLNTSTVAQVKRVSEESDLLPLLQFGTADAILLPEKAARALMNSTQMQLTEMEVASGAALPAVSVLDAERRAQIEGAVRGLGGEVNAKVGVDSWGRSP